MPKAYVTEPVSTDRKVVAQVKTPEFGALDVPPNFSLDALPDNRKRAIMGFLDAADWHEANTKAGGGLPGTADGRVVDGGEYCVSLITTQGATNIKNLKRAEFKPPSRNALINRIMEETTALTETDEGVAKIQTLRAEYGPAAKEKGIKWIEHYAQVEADRRLAELKAARDAAGGETDDTEEGQNQ